MQRKESAVCRSPCILVSLCRCRCRLLLSPQEATRALRPVLGQYYSQDKRNVFRALWEEISVCHWVAPEVQGSGITWFKTVGKDDYLTLSAKED